MNPDTLVNIIQEKQEIIRDIDIKPRNYYFERTLNYLLVGPHFAGKTTLLFLHAQELVKGYGIDWSQIVYLDFHDVRLSDFNLNDCNNILIAATMLSSKKHYYFFDNIEYLKGWERFARRLADQGERVYLTGSNSKVLGQDIILRLGGRYMTKYISPFNFREYLDFLSIPHTKVDLLKTTGNAKIRLQADNYLQFGGLPEAIPLVDKRGYLNNIYQNVFLADIIVRNHIRNSKTLSLLIRKISETVMHEVSFTSLYNAVKSVVLNTSRNLIMDYISFAEEAYLLFLIKNYYSKFTERESLPKYYFTDNGILNLFYVDKKAALLENMVAVTLHNKYRDKVFYLKSRKTSIDIDFYVPQTKTAFQVAWSIEGLAQEREIGNLVKLAKNSVEVKSFVIVTKSEERTIKQDGITIQVIPLYKFLLEN